MPMPEMGLSTDRRLQLESRIVRSWMSFVVVGFVRRAFCQSGPHWIASRKPCGSPTPAYRTAARAIPESGGEMIHGRP